MVDDQGHHHNEEDRYEKPEQPDEEARYGPPPCTHGRFNFPAELRNMQGFAEIFDEVGVKKADRLVGM